MVTYRSGNMTKYNFRYHVRELMPTLTHSEGMYINMVAEHYWDDAEMDVDRFLDKCRAGLNTNHVDEWESHGDYLAHRLNGNGPEFEKLTTYEKYYPKG